MKKNIQEFLIYAMGPIVILAILFIFAVIYRSLDLPSFDEVVQFAKDSFATHGYWVVFLGALAEGILFLNWYIPGSVVVVMGVVFARDNGLSVFWVVNCITLGFLVTAIFNYVLGKYGWYRLLLKFGLKKTLNKTKKRVEKHGLKIIFGTYFHPNIGALTATSAGILQLPFLNFLLYSILALIAWNTLWGLIVYFSGQAILGIITYQSLFLILVAWIVVLLFKFVIMKKKAIKMPSENLNKK